MIARTSGTSVNTTPLAVALPPAAPWPEPVLPPSPPVALTVGSRLPTAAELKVNAELAWFDHILALPGYGFWVSLRPVLDEWPRTQWTGARPGEER